MIYFVTVYCHTCEEETCKHVEYYDGGEDHILNMDAFLISHTMLRNYLRLFLTEGY